jgi:protein TonB
LSSQAVEYQPRYLPSSSASRATVLSFIVGAHALVVAAVVSMGGIEVVVKTVPVLVQLLPEPSSAKPPLPTRTLPPPELKTPDIKLPTPPPIENLYQVRMEEKPVLAPPALVTAVAVAAPPAPSAPSIEPPRFDLAYLNNPAPAYPVFAKRAREQGIVMLRVGVDPAGNVTNIDVHKSSGSQRLDDAALAAVKRWRFVPARAGERSVAGVALVPIHFLLEG